MEQHLYHGATKDQREETARLLEAPLDAEDPTITANPELQRLVDSGAAVDLVDAADMTETELAAATAEAEGNTNKARQLRKAYMGRKAGRKKAAGQGSVGVIPADGIVMI